MAATERGNELGNRFTPKESRLDTGFKGTGQISFLCEMGFHNEKAPFRIRPKLRKNVKARIVARGTQQVGRM